MQTKTKAAIIKAMVEATGWNPSLEAVVDQKIETSGKTTGGRAKKSSAKKGVDFRRIRSNHRKYFPLTEKVQDFGSADAETEERRFGKNWFLGTQSCFRSSLNVS